MMFNIIMKIQPIIARDYSVQNKQNVGFTALLFKPIMPLNSAIEISNKSPDIKIRTIYEKLRNQLPKVETHTIKKIIERFKDYPHDEVLQVMNRLTAFSNMTAFTNLAKIFADEKISNFIRFTNDYKIDVDKLKIKSEKQDSLKIKQPLNINILFEYFFTPQHGKAPLYISENKGLVIDSEVLKILEKKDLSSKLFNRCKFLYIKDFENTYNIFNQHNDFESMIKNSLEKLNILKKENPNESVENLLDKIFNPTLEKIKNMGITPIVINTTQKKNITPNTIAKNLSPKFPQYSEFKDTVKNCIKGVSSDDEIKMEILNIINQKIEAYSSKTFAKKIKKLHNLIKDSVKNKGKDVNKIYYVLPNLNKSFSLMAYLYQKINNIDSSKFVYADLCSLDHPYYYSAIDKEIPKGSTLVILDDASISGQSLFTSQIHYSPTLEKQNYDITFATIYSSDTANEYFNNLILQKNKSSNDDFIFTDYQAISFNEHLHNHKNFFKQSLLMLPHIAPDNNLSYLAPVFELFYPRKEFVQEAWDCDYL